MRNRKGQTILEYTVVIVIMIGVMITMKDYVKRGISGRLKTATDDFGDQYDPQHVNSSINYNTQSNSTSLVSVVNGQYTGQGQSPQVVQWTNRQDLSNTVETKSGFTQVGS